MEGGPALDSHQQLHTNISLVEKEDSACLIYTSSPIVRWLHSYNWQA